MNIRAGCFPIQVTVATTPTGRADSVVQSEEGAFFALPHEEQMSLEDFFAALHADSVDSVVYAQAQNNRQACQPFQPFIHT